MSCSTCGGTALSCNCSCQNITLPNGSNGINGNNGLNGTSPWLLKMTNQGFTLPGNQDGSVVIPTGPHTKLSLYHGTSQVAMNVAFLSVPSVPGLGIYIEQNGNDIDITLTDWITGETYRAIDLTYTDPAGGVFIIRWNVAVSKQGVGFTYYGESETDPADPYVGLWYRNPTSGIDKFWDGSAWQILVQDADKDISVWVEVTPAQIRTLYDTEVQLLPSPGMGKFLKFSIEAYYLKYGSAPYTGDGGDLGKITVCTPHEHLIYGEQEIAKNIVPESTMLSSVSSLTLPGAPAEPLLAEDQGVFMYQHVYATRFVNGDSSLWVNLKYRIVTLP